MIDNCRGVLNGSVLMPGSVSSDKLNTDSIRDLVRDIMDEGRNSWLQDMVRDIFVDSVGTAWMEDFFRALMTSSASSSWFADLICGLNCYTMDVLEVVPTDIVFPATGGESAIEILVSGDAEWQLTD